MVKWFPGMTVASAEQDVITQAFRFYHGNKSQTARSIGICKRTLDAKLVEYGIEKQQEDATGGVETCGTNTGFHVESATRVSEERGVSVREQEKVQKVSRSGTA